MALEELQIILYPYTDIFAFASAFLGVLLLWQIIKKKKDSKVKDAMAVVFSLFALTFVFNAIAEISWTIMEKFLGISPELSFPDVFWVIAQILLLSGFVYFGYFMYKQKGHKNPRTIILSLLVAIISGGIVYYLVSTLLIGSHEGVSLFEIFLDYYYPIIAALIVVASVSVYTYFKDAEFGNYILLIAIGAFFSFVGDTLYTYYSWLEIYGLPGVISDFSYGTDYLLATIAVYLLLTRWLGYDLFGKLKGVVSK